MRAPAQLLSPVLIAGSLIILVSSAIRGSFGVFQIPVAEEFSRPRADFGLALAIQNLARGIGQPIFGAIAERFGDRKAITLGALTYAAGLVLSSVTASRDRLPCDLGDRRPRGERCGPFDGAGDRHCGGFRRASGRCAGRGMTALVPALARRLRDLRHCDPVGPCGAAITPRAEERRHDRQRRDHGRNPRPRDLRSVLRADLHQLFSCGYQLGFIIARFPAFVTEMCGAIDPSGTLASFGVASTSTLGALSISLIGMANIGATLLAGWAGGRFTRKYLPAGIYAARTLAAAIFISLPITPMIVIVFSVVTGALWLATVPLTAGLVAHFCGLRYMGTLYGVVFFSQQIGGFVCVWLGGSLYNLYGDYPLVWWINVGVGFLSMLVHLPIREHRIAMVVPT